MQIKIEHIEELPKVVATLLSFAKGRKKMILNAPMGAGKTTFTKAFCAEMGVTDATSSPTYALVNEYAYEKNGEQGIIRHLDLYRLKNEQEALDIGIEDFLYDAHYTFIEWPDVILELLPEDVVEINIKITNEQERLFIFS